MLHILVIFALYLTLLITDLLLQVVNNCKWLHEASIWHQSDRHSKEQTSSNHKLHYKGLFANVCDNSFESTSARMTNKHDISSCLSEKKSEIFAKPKKNDKLIWESGDLFVTEAKTIMNECWLKTKVVSENVWCFLINWKQKSGVKICAIIALVVCSVAYCRIENYIFIRLAVVTFKVIGSEQK